jgi:hypothetical protein
MLWLVVTHVSPALAAEAGSEAAPDGTVDDPLARHRVPFPELAERTIGTASQPVEFNWRRSKVQGAVSGSQLFELNNFNSVRVGGLARFPTGNLIAELGASYVRTWDTPASEILALTPYRQPGRPDRMEIDINVGIPLAEGVVTFAPRFMPPVQLVLNGYVGFRYLLYPDGFAGMKAGKVFTAVLSPSLTQAEFDNLDDRRLDGMQVDSGRYGLMIGLGNDLYFKQGFFLSPRVSFALPILAPVSGTDLLLWGDFSLAIGVAR